MKVKNIKYILISLALVLFCTCAEDIEVFTGNIIGKVTDAKTGEALQGVSVTITPSGNTRTTGSDGIFEFLDLEPKQYEIQAKKDGYISNSKSVTVVTGSDVSGDIQLTPVVKEGVLALSTSSLNFGSQSTSLSFNIQNNGNKKINWNISELENTDWLSISPTSGSIEAGKSNAVVVKLNRNHIEGYKETTVIINADNESLPLKITAEAENKNSKISLSTNSLNFGTEYSTLSFDIKNIGNAGNVNWEITGVDVDWLTVSPMTGATAMDKSSAVKVNIDRSKLEVVGEHSTTIFVSADGESLSLRITAKAEEKFPKIELDKDVLDFGTENSILTFNIKNTGNAGSANWEIKGVEADWIRINPVSGTTGIDKSSAVKVEVDRSTLEIGKHSTTITVESNGESFIVSINAEKTDNRYLVLSPESLDLETETSKSFFIYSYNGSTPYKLYVRGNADWAYFSSTEGVLPEYVNGDINTFEMLTVEAVRDGLAPGEYSFTLIIRTDMGDYELPISMTVENTSVAGNEEIITCDDNLEFSLTSCKISGTTATLEMKVKNNGYDSTTLRISGGGSGSNSNSYAYDDQGNRYTASNLQVNFSGDYETNWDSSSEIPAGVTMKFTIKIHNVTSKSAVFDNINIKTNKSSSLILKNVPIEDRYQNGTSNQQTTGTVSSCCDDLEFTLLDCKYGSNYTTLKFRTKNIGYENTTLRITGGGSGSNSSYAYDDDGNKYTSSNLKVSLSGNYETNWDTEVEIPAGVTVNGEITFYNVSSAATEFSNITIKTNQSSELTFKNVKIRK